MKENYHKTFDPILEDYAFFENHSTEAQRDLNAYALHLHQLSDEPDQIRMLDFGSGNGSFTATFLQQQNWAPSKLELVLVEPGEKSRAKAINTLGLYSANPIQHYAQLPRDFDMNFDLILCNHVLYYVSDLDQTICQLNRCLKPNGKWLMAMAGMENALIRCWEYGFSLIGEEVPFYTGEDLKHALERKGLNYQQESVSFTIAFRDTKENRLKILRFLFGTQLYSLSFTSLLKFFDSYEDDGAIKINTRHSLFVVG